MDTDRQEWKIRREVILKKYKSVMETSNRQKEKLVLNKRYLDQTDKMLGIVTGIEQDILPSLPEKSEWVT